MIPKGYQFSIQTDINSLSKRTLILCLSPKWIFVVRLEPNKQQLSCDKELTQTLVSSLPNIQHSIIEQIYVTYLTDLDRCGCSYGL